MRRSLLSPRDLADAIGVSESSLRRWVDAGLIPVTRTAGGHRRIALADAVQYIRRAHITVVRPELLGLDELAAAAEASASATASAASAPSRPSSPANGGEADEGRALFEALEAGDDRRARGLVLSMYLAGRSVAGIFDGPLRSALARLGELWRHGEEGILREHLAVDICARAVTQVRLTLPAAAAGAPLALGGAPAHDPYLLPSLMAAATVADAGFREVNFGPATPVHLLGRAAREMGARLVWLSVSSPAADPAALARTIEDLAAGLRGLGAHLVIGGRMIRDVAPGPDQPNLHVARTMAELAALARGLANGRR